MRRILMLFLLFLMLLFPISASADIEIHYLDVGNADATIILADDFTILIDGGQSSSSQFLFSYLRNKLKLEHIDIIIATHPHADHIGGLSAAFNACSVGKIYSAIPMYNAAGSLSYDSREFRSLVKYATQQGLDFSLPAAGDTFQLGKLSIEFLSGSCMEDISSYTSSQINNLSLIVKLTYGGSTFLFSGDAETDSEYAAVLYAGDALRSDVLHAGHHGSSSSSSYAFLKAVQPYYTIISCGKDNSYGHPHEEILSRLQLLSIPFLRTDQEGTIIISSDGEVLSFTTGNKPSIDPVEDPREESPGTSYIGNKNSKVFHYPDCLSVEGMKEKNKIPLSSRTEAIEKGYKPCGECSP